MPDTYDSQINEAMRQLEQLTRARYEASDTFSGTIKQIVVGSLDEEITALKELITRRVERMTKYGKS